MTATECIARLKRTMDGKRWSPDTLDEIAAVLHAYDGWYPADVDEGGDDE